MSGVIAPEEEEEEEGREISQALHHGTQPGLTWGPCGRVPGDPKMSPALQEMGGTLGVPLGACPAEKPREREANKAGAVPRGECLGPCSVPAGTSAPLSPAEARARGAAWAKIIHFAPSPAQLEPSQLQQL